MNYCTEVRKGTARKPRMNAESRRNMQTVTPEELLAAAMGTAILEPGEQPPPPPPGTKTRQDRVYFIRMHVLDGPIKIGTSWNTYGRFTNLLTASPYELTYLGDIAGDVESEYQIHQRFDRLRMLGEWFHPDPELIGYISYELGRDTSTWTV